MRVLRHELLRVLVPHRRDRLQEGHELLGVRALVEEEIQAVLQLDDVRRVRVRRVLQDELLEPQEGALVRHLLPHLDDRRPRVLRLAPLAVGALLVAQDIFDDERLLQHRTGDHLLLDRQFQLDPARVRLRPDKRRVDEFHQ
eukprot:4395626-Prymnesium_polylepis.1